MNAIKAIWINGQIIPAEAVDWPEGCALIVEPALLSQRKFGIDESEWRDDPEAIADWEAWINTIQPPILTDEERASIARYEEEFRRFNIEAVRRQTQSGMEL